MFKYVLSLALISASLSVFAQPVTFPPSTMNDDLDNATYFNKSNKKSDKTANARAIAKSAEVRAALNIGKNSKMSIRHNKTLKDGTEEYSVFSDTTNILVTVGKNSKTVTVVGSPAEMDQDWAPPVSK